MTTPIAFFVYNRPDTTQQVISALQAQTVALDHLIIFSDGARQPADESRVNAVRELCRTIDWTEVKLVKRQQNFGAAGNVIEGLNEVLSTYDEVIIVEDDVLPAPHFVEAMSLLLTRYREDKSVFSAGGYPSILPDSLANYPYDVIMSSRFNAWGWATWADRWQSIAPRLRPFQNPFPDIEAIPNDAGEDIKDLALAVEQNPSLYWDLPVTLLCLHQGWFHALTAYYLVNNIGLSTGDHGSDDAHLLQFLKRNNQVSSGIPHKLPPSALNLDAQEAVHKYLREIHHLPGRRSLKGYYRKFVRKIERWGRS
ncbi:MAG: glycosyltransferase [Chloroflexota bacterium]